MATPPLPPPISTSTTSFKFYTLPSNSIFGRSYFPFNNGSNYEAAIIFIIFWEFLMFYLIFFSQQVKRCGIITYKQGICDLPLELPNNLRILGNKEKSGKSWKLTVSSYHAKHALQSPAKWPSACLWTK